MHKLRAVHPWLPAGEQVFIPDVGITVSVGSAKDGESFDIASAEIARGLLAQTDNGAAVFIPMNPEARAVQDDIDREKAAPVAVPTTTTPTETPKTDGAGAAQRKDGPE